MQMEMLEDECFYLNPFLAEIYSNCSGSSDASGAAAFDQLKLSSTSLINSWSGQETIIPSSSTIATAVEAPQLISFENERFSSFSPTNADHSMDCNNLTPQIISFSSSAKDDDDFGKKERASTATRTPLQAQDHLMAERKRREDLRQLFVALSKVVPGLKKLDKASLLEDAISHLKELQERVNALENEEMTRSIDAQKEDNVSFSSTSNSSCESLPAEISVRVRDRHVLIKICCKKKIGLMSRIPCEMERLHLNVVDIRIMPFGQAALDVTILAEMKSEFLGTVKDIIEHLQAVLGQI